MAPTSDKLFSYVERRTELGNSEYAETYLRSLRRAGRKHRGLASLLEAGNRISIRTSVRPESIAFVGGRFADLVVEVSRLRPTLMIATGAKDLQFALRQRLPPVYIGHLKALLASAYTSEEQRTRERYTGKALDAVTSILKRSRPRVVVLSQDSLFLERLVVLAARRLDILTCVVQDGLFMAADDPSLYHGHEADLVALWSEHFRELYVRRGDKKDRQLKVLGYPYRVPASEAVPSEPETICILGQPWETYSTNASTAKDAMVRNVCAAVPKGQRVAYRPHPRESRPRIRRVYSGIALSDPEETLDEAILKYGRFVSFTSTALLEVTLRRRQAVQVVDPAIPSDDFGKLGFAVTVANDVRALRSCLANPYPHGCATSGVPSAYVAIPDRPGQALLDLLDAYQAEEPPKGT